MQLLANQQVKIRKTLKTGKSLKFCLAFICSLYCLHLNVVEASTGETLHKPTIATSRPSLSDLLAGMGAALNSGNYEMSLVYIHDGQIDSLRLAHLSLDNNQFDMLEHLQGPKRMVVSHNGETWLYTGKERLHISSEEESPVIRWRRQLERLARNISHYKVVIAGMGRIAGRVAYELNFISRDKTRHGSRLWIDAEYMLPLRLDSINLKNNMIEQILTVNLNYPASLNAASFEVNEGFTETVEMVNLLAQQPQQEYAGQWQVKWLPAGFELSDRKYRGTDKLTYEHWLYSDGLSTLSVFLEFIDDKQKTSKQTFVSGDELIYDLLKHNMRITIVGNIPAKIAEKIARSVSYLQPETTPNFSQTPKIDNL